MPLDWAAPTKSPLIRAAGAAAALVRQRDEAMRQRLDTFLSGVAGTYSTPVGECKGVAPAFGMSVHYQVQDEAIKESRANLGPAAERAHLSPAALNRVVSGRGTPAEIHDLTQALIDNGHFVSEPGDSSSSGVRRTMFAHGIGMDCSSYTQQGYLFGHERTRASARLGSIENESLSRLDTRGYVRAPRLGDVRPGDIVVLGPPPKEKYGHRGLVYDQRLANECEIAALAALGPQAKAFATGDQIRIVVVDSSWGSGGDPMVGGAGRKTWWHNEQTGAWGWMGGAPPKEAFVSGPGPYGHPLEGFYREPNPADPRKAQQPVR